MASYLLLREFREIKNIDHLNYNNWVKPDMLELSAIQVFATRFVNPSTTNRRVLFKLGTGVGKTLTALNVALPFIKIFHVLYQKLELVHFVHIVGFSKSVFKKEFLKFPELGIITYEEIHELAKLRELSKSGPEYLKEEVISKYKNLKMKISRRLSTLETGGFYNFYGYRELYNALFTNERMPDDIAAHNIVRYFKEGKVGVNKIVLNKFKNAIMICDEIHLVYNSEEVNNYGLAIQFIIDYFETIYLILLTATIINNSKREVIDLANLIRTPGSDYFISTDYFKDNMKLTRDEWRTHLAKIYDQFKGKVLFLEESGADYPKLNIMGEEVEDLKYLKFDKCKMSEIHERTFEYAGLYEGTSKNFIILDMVLPNPDSAEIGLFDTQAIQKIENASESWKSKNKIKVLHSKTTAYISGSFLKYDNLINWSTKYCRMLDIIYSTLKKRPWAKFIIYHPNVIGSGIMMIGEILRYNGFTHYDDVHHSDSISADAFMTAKEWGEKYTNEFNPARYFVLDFDVSDATKDRIIDEWNSPQNRFGKHIKIFIGANKIKQSIDFKNTTEMIIVSKPKNIPEFIQIKGRIVRRNALPDLPKDVNNVYLHTLISTGKKRGSLEVRKYRKKLLDFDDIRNIEYHINYDAVNNYISPEFHPVDELGALEFKRTIELPDKSNDITFFGKDWYKDELNNITKVIKQAFVSIRVWTHELLYQFVSERGLTDKGLFCVALKNMIYDKNISLDIKSDNVFGIDNIHINQYYMNGASIKTERKSIMEIGQYYVLCTDIYRDCFLFDYKKNTQSTYFIDIKNSNLLARINFAKLSEETGKFGEEKMRKYAEMFLVRWEENIHYVFMEKHITGEYRLHPALIKMYQSLKIMGKNWYLNRIFKNVYDGEEWKTTPKETDLRDEFDIIGIIADSKFKIRPKAQDIEDNRLAERGIACSSVEKKKSLKVLKELGLTEPKKLRSKNICNSIFRELLKREIKARNSNDKFKYLYLFNE